jgi:hypothetical protein
MLRPSESQVPLLLLVASRVPKESQLLHPYLFLGFFSRPWTSYWVEDGEAAVAVLWAGTKRIVVSASHIDIAQGPLQKLFGFGDLVFRGDEGAEIMRWRNLRDVDEIRKRVRDAGKSGERFPAQYGDSNKEPKRPVFRNPRPTVWGTPQPVVLPEALESERWAGETDYKRRLVKRLYMAPDGQRLGILTASSVLFVQPADGSVQRTIAAPNCVGLALSSGDTFMAINLDDVVLCDAGAKDMNACRQVRLQENGRSHQAMSRVRAHPYQIAMSADGHWFAAHGGNSNLYVGEIRKTNDGTLETSVYRAGERATKRGEADYLDSDCMAVHPKGEWVALSDNKHWDRGTDLTLFDPRVDGWYVGNSSFPSSVLRAAFAFLQDRFEAGLRYREAFCVAGPPPDFPLNGRRPQCHAIRTDSNGAHIALLVHAGGHQFLRLLCIQAIPSGWDSRRQAESEDLGTIDCGRSDSRAFALSPDARLAATAGEDAVIRIWDTRKLYQVCELTCSTEPSAEVHAPLKIDGLAFHPNGRWLFSAERSGLIRRWTLTEKDGEWSAVCDLAMEALPGDNWVVWQDPDGPNRCWVDPSDEAKQWLGWRVPSGKYQTFAAF